MLFEFRTEEPNPGEPHLTTRAHLKLFGLHMAWSQYDTPVRPKSGAQIGIMSSTWIYTRRWAYGRGLVRDWATLQNLEIKIGTYPPVVTETGTFDLRPALAMPVNLEVRIHNRNQVDAHGFLAVSEIRGDEETVMVSHRFSVMANTQKLDKCRADRPFVAGRVAYQTAPSVGWKKTRIFGRPEWLG